MDPWLYQNMIVAQYFGADPAELGEWFNSDFLDALEFIAVQREIDRRAMGPERT